MKLTKEKIAQIANDVAEQVNREKGTPEDRRHMAKDFHDMVKSITDLNHNKQPTPPGEKGQDAARFIRAVAAGRGNIACSIDFAKKEFGDDSPVLKSLEASEAASGGVLVPTEYSTDIIELLRERATVRGMNPRIIPMTNGSVTIPKITGGATASYQGESDNIAASEQTFGSISLTWKKLTCITPISNDLLRFAAIGADGIVRDDLVAAMAQREDQAFLRGDGTENTPKGLYSWTPAANVITANATVNLANVTKDVAEAILALRNGLSRMINVGWIWAPRTTMFLKQIRDGNGNYAFKAELDGGNFWGFPYKDTTEVPINLSGTDTEIHLIDFADVLLGEANTLEVSSSEEATYWDGSALQSAFVRDLTLLKVLAHHDLAVRHEESLVRLDAVKWVL